jgi:hypothetical protein
MVPLIAFMCSGISMTEKKVFQLKNLCVTVFLFQVFYLRFFYTNFYFTTVSGSESKSELFFVFGSSQNIWFISDSDPQRCRYRTGITFVNRYLSTIYDNFFWLVTGTGS